MKILDLVLKHQWYDLIEDGIKTEEYRELKPYWIKRLMGCLKWCSIGCLYDKNEIEHCRRRKCENLTDLKEILEGYDVVRFHRAYTNITMSYWIKSITIGFGKSEWGVVNCFELCIFERLNTTGNDRVCFLLVL